MRKFKNKFYVVITNCDRKTAWYSNKIGTIQKVTDELFPPDYTLIYRKQHIYPMISNSDAVKLVVPSIVIKFFNLVKFFKKICIFH